MTEEDFLKILKTTLARVKYNNNWYEIRVAKGYFDKPFVDTNGSLFGVKNAKINFYVFKAGSEEIAEWAPSLLKDLYELQDWAKLPDEETDVSFELSYVESFIDYLFDQKGFLIFNRGGEKIKPKKENPNMVF